jgi:hypothetical protein
LSFVVSTIPFNALSSSPNVIVLRLDESFVDSILQDC